MGNTIKSDCTFGTLIIETDQKSYFAGSQVNGIVYMNLKKVFPSNTINLIISGTENVRFLNKNKKIIQENRTFYDYIFPLYSNKSEEFPIG